MLLLTTLSHWNIIADRMTGTMVDFLEVRLIAPQLLLDKVFSLFTPLSLQMCRKEQREPSRYKT